MTFKSIAVWLDHSKAKIISVDGDHFKVTTIHSPYNRHIRIRGKGNDTSIYQHLFGGNRESVKHHRKENELEEYFSALEKKADGCSDILIMGPTNAKDQFKNHLLKNKHFAQTNILVKKTDYITENNILVQARKFFVSVIKESKK